MIWFLHPPPPPPSLQLNNLSLNINNAVSAICSITRVTVHRTNETGRRWDSAGARSRLQRARALSITSHHTKCSLISEKRDEILTAAHHPSVGESSAVTYKRLLRKEKRRTVANPLLVKEFALWFLQEAPTDAITGGLAGGLSLRNSC